MTEHTLEQPIVSIIIPCFNAAKTLLLQLQALAQQIEPPPFEVIIADNRSTDNSQAIAREAASMFSMLRVVRATEEQGAAYARNVGAAAARGKYLMFCDADDVVASRWVAHGHRDFSVADCWTGSAIPADQQLFSSPLETIWTHIDDQDEPLRLDFTENSVDAPVLCGGCFGITRQLFIELGGFDQSMGSAGEDNEFAWRLTRGGTTLPVSKTAKIAYRTDSILKVRLKKTREAARSLVLLSRRHDVPLDYTRVPWVVRNTLGAVSALLRSLAQGKQKLEIRSAAYQRLASSRGAVIGLWRYRIDVPEARLGAGFDEGLKQRGFDRPNNTENSELQP